MHNSEKQFWAYAGMFVAGVIGGIALAWRLMN